MRERIRLLISMRDIAAASHLSQVIHMLQNDSRFEFRVFAQNPASQFLKNVGIEHDYINLPPALVVESKEAADLQRVAKNAIESYKPDAILCGLSSPFDGGIDEAFLATAKTPTFLLQDFWGEQNLFFGKPADVFFALDEIAKSQNKKRFGVESIITGSARHAAYEKINFVELRKSRRLTLGIPEHKCVIGFFGQALNKLPGYRRTLLKFIETVKELDFDFTLLVRGHPRESSDQIESLETLFIDSGLSPIFANEGAVDENIAVCDIVCSLFSNCTYDASYQNFFSPSPISVPVSMLFDPEIVEYCRERLDYKELPIHVDELVMLVNRPEDLRGILERASTKKQREYIWQRAKKYLPYPSAAYQLITDAIVARSPSVHVKSISDV